MSSDLGLRFLTSADRLDQLPDTACEVAVIGRSNVGKSSLINALAQQKKLARTSSTPGRTQLLNVFAADVATTGKPRAVVDLPGYGYAKVSKSRREQFQHRMEQYLLNREPLAAVAALVDGAVGPAGLDRSMIRWLAHHEVPTQVVATKLDKVKPSKRGRRRRELADALEIHQDQIIWVSADTGEGIEPLRKLIISVLEQVPGDGAAHPE